ncbi:MAG: suppressor of fused domain protein [Flavobacteriales bacterium]|nr:suppressor of fused domain protein [Flavobacteriales bacterium]
MDKNIICSAYFPKTDTHALVQEENDCVYLYMYIRPNTPEQEIRASWVRNYGVAINGVDQKAINEEKQPRMPQKACTHPQGAPKFRPEDLSLVFLEDGDGVALKEKDQLLAVIPGWASSGEFTGYARDAVGTSPFAWELGTEKDNEIFAQVASAEKYWNDMLHGNAWTEYRDTHMEAIEKMYGKHSEYLAVDNGEFPPKALVVVEKKDTVYLFTIGMGTLAMPTVEMCTQNPQELRRCELAMAMTKTIWTKDKDQFLAFMSGLADIPWAYTTFLADGHTVLFDIKPYQTHFTNAMLLDGEINFNESLFPAFRNDKLNLLWVVPITKIQQEYAEENGNEDFMLHRKKDVDLRVFTTEEKFDIKGKKK